MDIATRMLLMDGGKFATSSLFRANEQGVWYDPSDLTTLFQDAAGTIPVTAVEQPVGLMLDKSGRGNHAYQATSANRPTLSARYNLLTYSEDFSNAVWNAEANGLSISSGYLAPNGTLTGNKITELNTLDYHRRGYDIYSIFGVLAVDGRFSIYAKAGERDTLRGWSWPTGAEQQTFNLTTGVCTGNQTPLMHYIVNGWWKCSFKVPAGNTTVCFGTSNGIILGTGVYQGDGTSGLYVWGADLRPSNHGTDLPPYQRVTAGTDYDTVGFPPYLAFNGMSSSMVTNSIDFSATDKMSVWAGVRKFSDTALGVISELSAVFSENNGAFGFGINDPSSNFFSGARGTIPSYDTSKNPATSPGTYVTMVKIGISNDVDVIRKNGADGLNEGSDLGTGNFGNYPLYIGARNQSQHFFNGSIYSLIIRGAQSTDKQVSTAESWINKKIGKVY